MMLEEMGVAEYIEQNLPKLKFNFVTLHTANYPEDWVKKDAGPNRYMTTLKLDGRTMNVEFKKGIGLIQKRIRTQNVRFGGYNVKWEDCSAPFGFGRYNMVRLQEFFRNKRPAPPTMLEVVECLVMDGRLLEDYPLWPDFAANLGYDEDSIKARNSYDETVKQTLEARALFGNHWYKLVNCETS